MPTAKSVFIERDAIRDVILKIGVARWSNFNVSALTKSGNCYRCNIRADGKKSILDFHFKADGSATIISTGRNQETSATIKALLEQKYANKKKTESQAFAFKKLPPNCSMQLIAYLSSLVGIRVVHRKLKQNQTCEVYKFTDTAGDTLTVTVYAIGTVTIQGKASYLYSEAISVLSQYKTISADDIINTVNNFHNIVIFKKNLYPSWVQVHLFSGIMRL